MAKSLVTLTVLTLCLIVSLGVEGFGSIVGGRTEVEDVKANQEVQKLGRYAVEEFNRRRSGEYGGGNGGGEGLRFSQVVDAEKQVVSGLKYYLKIEAIKNGEMHLFDAVVVVKPWIHSKVLLHFAPSTRDR